MKSKSSRHGDGGKHTHNLTSSRNGNPVTERYAELTRQGIEPERALEIVRAEQAQLEAVVELAEQQAATEEESGDVLRESILDQTEQENDGAGDIIFNDDATRVVISGEPKVVTSKDLQRMADTAAKEIPSLDDRSWAHYEALRDEPDGTMPKGGERYRSALNRLIRGCKSEPEFKGLDRYESRDLMAELMEEWNPPKLGNENPWTFYLGQFSADPEAEWITGWRDLKYGLGEDPLDLAMSEAMSNPFIPLRSMSNLYDLYISIGANLALRNSGAAKLPQDRIAKLLGVSQGMISNYQKEAVKCGFLERTKAHVYRPGKRGDCAEFRFALERFDVNGREIVQKKDKVAVGSSRLRVVGGRDVAVVQ